MIRKIVQHPDPVLRQVAGPVTAFDEMLEALATDMLETMYDASGRGLAAPQVGITRRLFVTDTSWKNGARLPLVFVNPEITRASDEQQIYPEGCLSIPGQIVNVSRPARVHLRWKDVAGADHSGEFSGFAAACVQHEFDHLNGVLCIDYQEKQDAG